MIGNRRKELFAAAIEKTELDNVILPEDLIASLFEDSNPGGLYGLFQHAVHLVTIDRIALRTSPENFNFIFKHPDDDDVYEVLYTVLPTVLLYLAHVILTLYERIKPMDPGAKRAFVYRTVYAYPFLYDERSSAVLSKAITDVLASSVQCADCGAPLKTTTYNTLRLLLTDTFRCSRCRRKQPFPLSWLF